MILETLGHASLCIRDGSSRPLLLTDPWLIGSCYWRSWWLQNYPSKEMLDELKATRYCYLTHTHPDHFHTASIRRLGPGPQYLCPQLPQERMAEFLNGHGHSARVLKPFRWYRLGEGVALLSIPLLNDDSALLIDTATATIINLNDSKPTAGQLKRLAKFLERQGRGKRRILLSSYSPASIVNSFLRGAERVSIKEKRAYVNYVCRNCQILAADVFMPFASQVIFYRSDSAWANEYKVDHRDLAAHWSAPRTELLPPYANVDLETFETGFIQPEDYNHDPHTLREKALAQEAVDKAAEFTAPDIERLERKMNRNRYLLAPLFRRGIGFSTDRMELSWSPWSGKVTVGQAKGSFTLRIPTQALRDALEFGHFGDLGITMFTLIVLNERTDPRLVYVFFMLNTLHDYRHTTSFRNFVEWAFNSLRIRSWKFPDPGHPQALAQSSQ